MGTMPDAAQRTAAFGERGESVLAPAADDRVQQGSAAELLLNAMKKRLGLDRWVWAFGSSPDELQRRDEVGTWMEESRAHTDDEGRLIDWLATGAASHPPRRLALEFPTAGTATRFCRFLGAGLPFWICDRDMGIRLAFRERRLSFRAHHPVIHRALADRCEKEGLFLL
jgi:hypothetical protein